MFIQLILEASQTTTPFKQTLPKFSESCKNLRGYQWKQWSMQE